jgi:hypothetical protein
MPLNLNLYCTDPRRKLPPGWLKARPDGEGWEFVGNSEDPEETKKEVWEHLHLKETDEFFVVLEAYDIAGRKLSENYKSLWVRRTHAG